MEPAPNQRAASSSQPSKSSHIGITGPLRKAGFHSQHVAQIDRRNNPESELLIVKLPTQDVSSLEAKGITHNLWDRELPLSRQCRQLYAALFRLTYLTLRPDRGNLQQG